MSSQNLLIYVFLFLCIKNGFGIQLLPHATVSKSQNPNDFKTLNSLNYLDGSYWLLNSSSYFSRRYIQFYSTTSSYMVIYYRGHYRNNQILPIAELKSYVQLTSDVVYLENQLTFIKLMSANSLNIFNQTYIQVKKLPDPFQKSISHTYSVQQLVINKISPPSGYGSHLTYGPYGLTGTGAVGYGEFNRFDANNGSYIGTVNFAPDQATTGDAYWFAVAYDGEQYWRTCRCGQDSLLSSKNHTSSAIIDLSAINPSFIDIQAATAFRITSKRRHYQLCK